MTNQTTMSQWDVHDIMELVKEKYPHVEYHQEICLATQVRQEAVSEQAKSGLNNRCRRPEKQQFK